MNDLLDSLDPARIPGHIAIIMDGMDDGRIAAFFRESRGTERVFTRFATRWERARELAWGP